MYPSTISLILLAIVNLFWCCDGFGNSCPLFTVEFCCFAIYDIDGSITIWLCERPADVNAKSCDTELGLHPKCCPDNIFQLAVGNTQEIFQPDECHDPPPLGQAPPKIITVPSLLCLDCDLSVPQLPPLKPARPATLPRCSSRRKKRIVQERDDGSVMETFSGLTPTIGTENDGTLMGFDSCSR